MAFLLTVHERYAIIVTNKNRKLRVFTMKKILKTMLKILKWIGIVILGLIIILLIVRCVGKLYYNRTPDGGINETMYVDINGTKQWISIYGQDKDNPVLLYLHGGPCYPTVGLDWSIFRKLSADYTVVEWDQRGCGHNYPDYKEEKPITAELMISDGKAMTDYLCDYLHKDKITLYGHSWGSLFAANLALDYPNKYDALIVSSLVVDESLSRQRFKEYMLEQSTDDPEIHAAAEKFDTSKGLKEQEDNYLKLAYSAYSYSDNIFSDSDENMYKAIFFNPYCTLAEEYRLLMGTSDYDKYIEEVLLGGDTYGDGICSQIPISQRTEYEMPFYLIEGSKDHGVSNMVEVAVDYFETVNAPDKDMICVDGGHGSPMLRCNQLAEFIHRIAEKQKSR